MKNKFNMLKKINDKTAEEINQKFPADWDMDRIFKSSYKKYVSRKQAASDIAQERVTQKMTDRAVDVKIIRKGVLLKTIAVLGVLAAVTTAAAVFSSMKKERHEQKPVVTENYFVDVNYIMPECIYYVTDFIKAGDRVIISGNMEFSENKSVSDQYDKESEAANGICITDMSGKIISKTKLKLKEGYIQKTYISDNSDIYVYMVDNQYECDENGNAIPPDNIVIEHLDDNGTHIGSTSLDIQGVNSGTDMLVDSKGRYVITDNENRIIYLLDTDGSIVSEVKCGSGTDKLHVFMNDDGVFQLSEIKDITEIRKIDFEKKTTEEIAQMDFTMQYTDKVFSGNNVYDFFLAENDGIYGYSLKGNKQTEIVNYIESDMLNRVNDIWVSDEDYFSYGYYENKSPDIRKYSLMTRSDDETLKKISQKKVITVACNIGEVWNCAAQFNKNSDEYRIKVKDYSSYWSPDNRFSYGSFGKLNEDMIRGDIPDVIICNQEFDISRYASMGAFADINELMKNDSELSRSDFFENILDACQTDGKLYYMPSKFSLNTLSGKMSVLGERSMLTFDQFFDMNKKQPVLIDEYRYDLMNMFIRNNLSEFVDFSDRTCDFDNEDFTQLLGFIKTYGISYSESENRPYDEYRKRVAEDRCSCFMSNVYSYKFESDDQQINFGDEKEVSYIGLPSRDGGSAVAEPFSMIAITENSANKDAAWKFVKTLFSEENQMEHEYSFPILKSAFEKQAENALIIHDPYGAQTKDLYGKYITMKPVDKVLVGKIRTLTESVRHASVSDSGINSIIDEQTELFFNGGQSAEETAKQIQKKVEIYLKEID